VVAQAREGRTASQKLQVTVLNVNAKFIQKEFTVYLPFCSAAVSMATMSVAGC
jgi:hypothetical protein